MRPSLALEANADRVMTILSRFDVKNPRILGSAARADDDDESDLDILVDPGEDLTFFDWPNSNGSFHQPSPARST